MFSRDEIIRQRRLERQQKNELKQQETSLQTQQEIQREKLRNTRIRLSIDPSKTWEDVKREEEVKRKDRIEKRKEELQQSSRYSEGLSKSVEKWKTLKFREGEESAVTATAVTETDPRRGSKGRVLSPEEVSRPYFFCSTYRSLSPSSPLNQAIANLKRQQEKWDQKIKQTQLLTRATRKDLTPAQSVIELERRNEEYLERRQKKSEEKREQEEREQRKKEEDERKRREKIIQSQPPEGSTRLTKAVEERVKAVS
jgi:hypothetical protein